MRDKATWDDIRPLIEAAKDQDAIKATFGRALDKWTKDVWDKSKLAKAEDFPDYFIREHHPRSPLPSEGEG